MKKILTMPVKSEDITNLRTGDVIYINGMLATCRDSGHKRRTVDGVVPEFNFNGNAVLHAGPIMKHNNGTYEAVAVGPTTSMRMEAYEADFIEQTGVKIIIGKGGMGDKTAAACREHKVIQCVIPGGCAVMAAEEIEKVENVEWLDLGTPEALWVCKVHEFGPLIVAIDTTGANLFEETKKHFNQIRDEEIQKY